MKYIKNVVLCLFALSIVALLMLSPRDVSINSSHFSNAWSNPEKSQYLLISNPNAFMEGVIYTATDEKITEKNSYSLNSTHNEGQKVFFNVYRNGQSSAKIFQVLENDTNSMTIDNQHWYKVIEQEQIERLIKLVEASI